MGIRAPGQVVGQLVSVVRQALVLQEAKQAVRASGSGGFRCADVRRSTK